MSKAILWVVGTPLNSEEMLSPRAAQCLTAVDGFIGESRKVALRYLSRVPDAKEKPLYFLDESSRPEEKNWQPLVRKIASEGGAIALFSDTGMPLLFDPGQEVLQACLAAGFAVRSCSAATSWGSACALSGWDPPFFLAGFPPRQNPERERFWKSLQTSPAHCVFMERPYRFQALLAECASVFGRTRPAFLAWELDSTDEKLLWGTLEKLERSAKNFEKTKGEYVLLIQGAPLSKPKKNFS